MVEVGEEGGEDEGGGISAGRGGGGGGGGGGREGGREEGFGEEVLGGDPGGRVPELDDAEDVLWGREEVREGGNE